MATSNEVLQKILAAKKATNINNINYNNNINNINNINDSMTSMIAETSHNQVDQSLRSSLGLASLSASPQGSQSLATPIDSISFAGGSELPPVWRGVKWDLYKNPGRNGKFNLKVKMSVIKQDRKTQSLTASLNSPHDRLWRGIEDPNTPHWQSVREIYQDYRTAFGASIENWRVSKFYLDSKKASVDIMAVFLHWTDANYCVRLVLDGTLYDFEIAKDSYLQLSDQQLKTNQVATAFFGQSQVKMINPRDLGLL